MFKNADVSDGIAGFIS